jgi:broad specificity phosphatase PhoE
VNFRTVVLVRHGEYDTDETGLFGLTARGRLQAEATARHLATETFDTAWASTMPRARQTAEIVCRPLEMRFRTTPLLVEGAPTTLRASPVSPEQVDKDIRRMERAWARFFAPSPGPSKDILFCHANLIRFFMTRVLAIRTRAWTRFVASHCGISRVIVLPRGSLRLVSYNETAHLPGELVTQA